MKNGNWLLKRTEHFIALYNNGKISPELVCYEIFNGFIMAGYYPLEQSDGKKHKHYPIGKLKDQINRKKRKKKS